ncbi:hypothetical protein SAMN05216203_0661 [Marinobacter daqiaonensis]|uniref:Uncharacterized protein n=1 Tax=Marinobacter daqiaonensis TaxID=650891 RepID=A0A1I6H0B2_9GAMM|nr:hypothetical protein SAMN05216203_0661 [Marinobacter daqiaonensis]
MDVPVLDSRVAEGKPRPCPWDGVGGRLVWYAYAVALPEFFFNDMNNRQLMTSDVKKYTTSADRLRAWAFMIAGHGFVLLVFTAVILILGDSLSRVLSGSP